MKQKQEKFGYNGHWDAEYTKGRFEEVPSSGSEHAEHPFKGSETAESPDDADE